MALVPYFELIPEVQSQAQKAAIPAITRALHKSAVEFCRRAEVWRYRPPLLDVVQGTAEVTLTLPEQTVLTKVVRASLDGKVLDHTSEILLDQRIPDWRTREAVPSYCFRTGLSQVTIAPVPNQSYTGALDITLALQPIRAATGIEDVVVDEYEAAIVDGALAILLKQSNQEWADPQLGLTHESNFNMAIDDAIAAAQLDNTAKKRVMTYGGY